MKNNRSSILGNSDGLVLGLCARLVKKDPHSALYDYDLPDNLRVELDLSKFVARHQENRDNSSMIINGPNCKGFRRNIGI